MSTNDTTLEALERRLKRDKERSEKSKAKCGNCMFFVGSGDEGFGQCIRHPPKAVPVETVRDDGEFRKELIESLPRVPADNWVCGEFLHKRDGFTFYGGNEYRVAEMMRVRLAELEERIDFMMEKGGA